MKYIFIVNPISGGKSKSKLIQYLNEFCLLNKVDFLIRFTQYPIHGKEIAREYADSEANVIIAVGGDGTVNEVASSLINKNALFHVIPTGSGNGFARFNNIPLDYKKNLSELIKMRNYLNIDVCYLNEMPFFNVSGIGFDAYISKKFTELSGRGFGNYVKAVWSNFKTFKNQKYEIKTEIKFTETEAFFISFANTSQFGNNVHIAPDAQINDGLIELVLVKKIKIRYLPIIALKLFLKKKINLPEFTYTQNKEIQIKGHNMHVHIDGEPLSELYEQVNVRIATRSLKLIRN
jgi:diacylglycerol kinase (ATP)